MSVSLNHADRNRTTETGHPDLPMVPVFAELQKLLRARNVLGGRDEDGVRAHASMFDRNVISFAHGEGIRRPHPKVIGAGVRALLDHQDSSLENYLFLQRVDALDAAVEDRFIRIGIPPHLAKTIVYDAGTTRLIGTFLDIVTQRSDSVLTAPSFYHPLAAWCAHRQLRLFCVPTARDNDFKLTRSDLETWWRSSEQLRRLHRPAAFVLFNPTMTGAVYSQSELDEISDFLASHSLFALEDAIFAETEFDVGQRSGRLAANRRMENRTVTVSGASKAHCMANLRIGWACGPASIMRELEDRTISNSASIPQITKLMALAALRSATTFLRENRKECRARAGLLRDLISGTDWMLRANRPDLDRPLLRLAHDPDAGHSVLIDFSGLLPHIGDRSIADSVDLTRYFLTDAAVAFSPGLSIGHEGLMLRCNFASIGTAATFEHSEEEELACSLAQLASWRTARRLNVGGDIAIGALRSRSGPMSRNSGFDVGRNLIRAAWNQRVVPAIERLVRLPDVSSRADRTLRHDRTVTP